MLGNTLGTLNSLQVFLAGIALALVFCLSLAIMAVGARVQRLRRAARLALLRDAARTRAERDSLATGWDPTRHSRSRTTTRRRRGDRIPRVPQEHAAGGLGV